MMGKQQEMMWPEMYARVCPPGLLINCAEKFDLYETRRGRLQWKITENGVIRYVFKEDLGGYIM